MTGVVEIEQTEILTVESDTATVVQPEKSVDIIVVAEQGPRGVQGPPGPAGGATLVEVGADQISGHSAVAYGSDGRLIVADCRLSEQFGRVLGITENAYLPGDPAIVRQSFSVEHIGWSWTPGPVFAGQGGALTQTLPAGAVFVQVIGFAISPTVINVDPQPPILIA